MLCVCVCMCVCERERERERERETILNFEKTLYTINQVTIQIMIKIF